MAPRHTFTSTPTKNSCYQNEALCSCAAIGVVTDPTLRTDWVRMTTTLCHPCTTQQVLDRGTWAVRARALRTACQGVGGCWCGLCGRLLQDHTRPRGCTTGCLVGVMKSRVFVVTASPAGDKGRAWVGCQLLLVHHSGGSWAAPLSCHCHPRQCPGLDVGKVRRCQPGCQLSCTCCIKRLLWGEDL